MADRAQVTAGQAGMAGPDPVTVEATAGTAAHVQVQAINPVAHQEAAEALVQVGAGTPAAEGIIQAQALVVPAVAVLARAAISATAAMVALAAVIAKA
jgi:hypothetical protein